MLHCVEDLVLPAVGLEIPSELKALRQQRDKLWDCVRGENSGMGVGGVHVVKVRQFPQVQEG